jgi:hypothetical protein
MTRPLIIINFLKIHIHGIPYISTFTIAENSVVDFNYSMLLRRVWLRDDWGNNVIIVQGNGIVKLISVNRKLGEELEGLK